MKFLKPAWVNHEGYPIFSVDIHPDGSRFATGGQGVDCGRIVIWNLGPVISEADEHSADVPKQLCRLDNHLSCVNCVRWSHSGRYLASAGDDKVIMIWSFAGQGGISFGGQTCAEQWRCANNLSGHNGDILHIDWSPGDRYLASCSVDNTIRIWNANNLPECLHVIKGHAGLVKGVSWDPMGKYLCSQSDDKSLKIWRTSDWKEEASITKPFVDCGGTTHALRLAWCPDGQFLVSAHAMNNLGSTAQIIDRDTWKTEKDFVGHRKAVSCVRFCTNMLTKQRKDSKKRDKFFLLAVGSRDRSLSLWLTNLRRPLVVMHDMFKDSILDMSWAKDGFRFLACSCDGTVSYFEFDNDEIGEFAEKDEFAAHLHGIYGKSMLLEANGKSNNLDFFVEDVQLLTARNHSKQLTEGNRDKLSIGAQNGRSNSHSRLSNTNDSQSPSKSMMKGPTDKQIETRLSDGKRRITPLFIPPIINGDGMPVPFKCSNQTTFGSSSETESRIRIEKVGIVKRLENGNHVDLAQSNNTDSKSSPAPVINGITNHHSSSGDTGKPVLLESEINQNTPKASQKVISEASTSSQISSNKDRDKEKETSQDRTLAADKAKTIKRKQDASSNSIAPPSKITRDDNLIEPITFKQAEKRTPSEKPQREKVDTKLNLRPLKIDKNYTMNLKPANTMLQHLNLIIDNETVNNLSSITLADKVEAKWKALFSSRISGAACSNDYIAVTCDDFTVHVFNLVTGSRQMSPLLLPSLASIIHCVSDYLLIVTCKSQLWMWNVREKRVHLRNVSLLPLNNNSQDFVDVEIVRLSVTESNMPFVQLSSGRSYIYNANLEAWQFINDSHDILQYSCDYRPPHSQLHLYPLERLQSIHSRSSQNIFHKDRALQSCATLSFIDQKLNAALTLQSKRDYQFWLTSLARYLVQEGHESRFRELCEFLLGPPFRSPLSDWKSSIVGLDKHDLLREVLQISTNNLKLQRVYLEFKEQLQLATSV